MLDLPKIKSYGYQLISRIGPQGLSMLIGIVIVRLSGKSLLGEYASIIALIGMSYQVISSGIFTSLLRGGDSHACDKHMSLSFFAWLMMLFPMLLLAYWVLMGDGIRGL